MFFHLFTHVVTHEVMQQTGRVRVADGYYRDAGLTRRALLLTRALAWLACGWLLVCWLVTWTATGPALPWKAALCSEAGFVLVALNFFWMMRHSPWLNRLGALSSLLQLAAGIAFAVFSGIPAAQDSLARFCRVCLVVLPAVELMLIDLCLYHRWRLIKLQDQSFLEEPVLE